MQHLLQLVSLAPQLCNLILTACTLSIGNPSRLLLELLLFGLKSSHLLGLWNHSFSLPQSSLAVFYDLEHTLVRKDRFSFVKELEIDILSMLLNKFVKIVGKHLLSLFTHLIVRLCCTFLRKCLLHSGQLLLEMLFAFKSPLKSLVFFSKLTFKELSKILLTDLFYFLFNLLSIRITFFGINWLHHFNIVFQS